ncbi:CD109 [Cordylochernes scorpioides]|uniref:CD109 n=1 Tax=Cordylochernes scorpioides TaxID=51811 RepID=A0ABY6LXU7_9ARAC|nr:CD109 [Cordylochernes scorpioides]
MPDLKLLFVVITLGLLLHCNVGSASSGYYSVVAPSAIRPNMEYILAMDVYNVPSPVQFIVSIDGSDKRGNRHSTSTVAILPSGTMQIAGLSIGEWMPGNYSLTVSGRGGLNFTNEMPLLFKLKSYSVFIQTDKAIYRPGDKVQLRAIIIDPNLIPTLTGAIEMRIMDPNGNWIKQWRRIFTMKDYSLELIAISQKPLLDWSRILKHTHNAHLALNISLHLEDYFWFGQKTYRLHHPDRSQLPERCTWLTFLDE